MKHSLYRIWGDIRHGENIDLYLAVGAAVVLTCLNVIGVAPQGLIASITLAVLAVLAISDLAVRTKLDTLLNRQETSPNAVLLLREYPPTFAEHLRQAQDILLIGYQLRHILDEAEVFAVLENKVKSGHKGKVRILLIDPGGVACSLATERIYQPTDEQTYRARTNVALQRACALQAQNPKQVEIKVIDQLLSFCFHAFDTKRDNGVIYLHHYPVKYPTNAPRMVLTVRDGHWYTFFREQAEYLWTTGRPWLCTTSTGPDRRLTGNGAG